MGGGHVSPWGGVGRGRGRYLFGAVSEEEASRVALRVSGPVVVQRVT